MALKGGTAHFKQKHCLPVNCESINHDKGPALSALFLWQRRREMQTAAGCVALFEQTDGRCRHLVGWETENNFIEVPQSQYLPRSKAHKTNCPVCHYYPLTFRLIATYLFWQGTSRTPSTSLFLYLSKVWLSLHAGQMSRCNTQRSTPSHARGDRRGYWCRWKSVLRRACGCASALTPPAFCCRTSRAEARLPRA